MGATEIVVILFLVTLGAVLVFALVSKKKIEDRRHDPAATKSTLAEDKSSTGKPADV
ncbi:hypothetical protein GGQ68_001969 [Sagittula marina]|uniref:Uncharacterized protein n=1 Tax=Sagittula marina TaxID=943940 RepID=A0A7W6GRS0_9RHOB|nr:hypothetical protein [Sagittula marina]MBB3985636.1 hypothetical protein [Sagittula marina]